MDSYNEQNGKTYRHVLGLVQNQESEKCVRVESVLV
jgi:hypothetical protein